MNLDSDLLLLAENPNASICTETLALSLAMDEYPNLDIAAYKSEIAAFSHGCKLPGGTDLEVRVRAFTHYLSHDLGFTGNKNDYYDPQNSYLNLVIDRRMGIPISLSVLAICIGKKLGLRLLGSDFPGTLSPWLAKGTIRFILMFSMAGKSFPKVIAKAFLLKLQANKPHFPRIIFPLCPLLR